MLRFRFLHIIAEILHALQFILVEALHHHLIVWKTHFDPDGRTYDGLFIIKRFHKKHVLSQRS